MNWSDPTFLKSASAWFQAFAIVLVFLGGFSQVGKWLIDRRERHISSAIAAKKDKANEDEKRGLREQLEASEKRIRSLVLNLEVDFRAKWKPDGNPVGHHVMWTGSKAAIIEIELSDGSTASVEFGPPEGISFTHIEPDIVRLFYRAAVTPGSPAFSLFPDQIIAVRVINFAAIGINATALEDTTVVVDRLVAGFIANGRVHFSALDEPHLDIEFNPAESGTVRLKLAGHISVVHGK